MSSFKTHTQVETVVPAQTNSKEKYKPNTVVRNLLKQLADYPLGILLKESYPKLDETDYTAMEKYIFSEKEQSEIYIRALEISMQLFSIIILGKERKSNSIHVDYTGQIDIQKEKFKSQYHNFSKARWFANLCSYIYLLNKSYYFKEKKYVYLNLVYVITLSLAYLELNKSDLKAYEYLIKDKFYWSKNVHE